MAIIGSPVSGVNTDSDLLDVAMVLLGNKLYSKLTIADDAYVAANALYALTRDSVMAEHPWNGCVGMIALTAHAGTPLFDWSYQYDYPLDCLRALRLEADHDQWEIGYHPTDFVKLLWADVSPANLRYIFRNLNVATYSPYLASAIAARMAMALAQALTAHQGKFDRLARVYKETMDYSKAQDGQEQSPIVLASTTLTDEVRQGG